MGSLWITHLLLLFLCLELNQIDAKSLPDHTNVDHNITLINPSDPRFSMLINGFAHGASLWPAHHQRPTSEEPAGDRR